MKDLPLSVLSRGCGQFVPCEGQQNRRLDVCFTPEDYFIWKTHGPSLRLSPSGSVLTEPEPTLPKTFSTRRGALLLYSQGLVTWKTCPSNAYNGNYYGQCRVHQGEPLLSTESTSKESILNYPAAGLESNHGIPTTLPPLYHLQRPDIKYFGTLLHQEGLILEQHVRTRPLSFSAESQHEEGRKRSLDVHLSPITTDSHPQTQHHSWENTLSTSENPMRTSVEQIGKAKETNQFCGAIKSQPSSPSSSSYKRIDDEISSTNTSRSELNGGSEVKLIGESKSSTGAFLPPLKTGQSVKHESYPVPSNRVSQEQFTDHLPPIDESKVLSHKPQDANSVHDTCRLQQPLYLPRLAPDKSEEAYFQKKRKEKSVNEHKCETFIQKVTEGCDNTITISFNTGEACNAPFRLLMGKRGPGHQSSLAFLQKISEEPSEGVRGILPLELRDLNGQAVGSLILGPDGEIIQLSMLDNIQDCSQGLALEVMSAKGEKLPWVVVLQPEHQLTEENKEKVFQRFNIQTDHFFSELSDLQRPQDTDPVKMKAHSKVVDSTDVNDTKSVIKASKKKLIGENTVPNSSNLDQTEVEKKTRDDTRTKDKKDRGGGQLSHLQQQQQRVATNKPNEMPAHNISPKTEATSQNTTKDSKKIKQIKGTEERPIANTGKIKDVTPKQQTERMSETGQNDDLDKTVKKRVWSIEAKTRDMKKTNDDKRSSQDQAEEASGERSQKKRKGKLRYKDVKSEEAPDQWTSPAINSSQDIEEEINKHRRDDLSAKQKQISKSDAVRDGSGTDRPPVKELRLNSDARSRSVRSFKSSASGSARKHSGSQKSMSSIGEGRTLGGASAPLSLSRSRLSSCSTVMIPEERLMLNPTKAEAAVTEQTAVTQEDSAVALEAERATIQRQEERKRRELEEELQRQQQREELEQKMKNELQNERQRRAEEIRVKKQAEEEERLRGEEEDEKRKQRQQEQQEREMRRQQERKRQMEHFQKKRAEEEQRRKAEMEQLQLLKEKKLQEEKIQLQNMNENERAEYLREKQEEENMRQREEEERRRREEEGALLAAQKAKIEEELLAREMALLHQRLSFKRGLTVESEGLEKSQSISRPWTYSYFTLLQMLGLSSAGVPHT